AAERWWRATGRARHLAVGFGAVVVAVALGWAGSLAALAPGPDGGRPARQFAEAIRRRTPGPVLLFRTGAHAVAFRVGRPVHPLLEWENLAVWAGKPAAVYVVMPPDCAAEWPRHLRGGRLVEVLRTGDLTPHPHARPLVLLRTEPIRRPE